MTTDREQEYGHIELREDKVLRTLGGQTTFSIPVTEIKVIGEFTTNNGPYLDDWFLTIITATDWYEIPLDVIGTYQLLTDLGQKLGTAMSFQLTNSTEWKTRIMFPDNFKDKELYQIVSIAPMTILEKAKKIIGISKTVREFSIETKMARDMKS